MKKIDINEIMDHLGDVAGFFGALYAFGIIGKNHPVYRQLDEIAKKNKLIHDNLDDVSKSAEKFEIHIDDRILSVN